MEATLNKKPLEDSPTNTAENVTVAAATALAELRTYLDGKPGKLQASGADWSIDLEIKAPAK